jgi:hypothetical protein
MEIIIEKPDQPTELQKFFMETETPRTDAEASDGWSGDAVCVSVEFARKLETEAQRYFEQMGEAWDEREKLQSQLNILSSALKQLAECKLTPENCASLDVASKRVRNIARIALSNARDHR